MKTMPILSILLALMSAGCSTCNRDGKGAALPMPVGTPHRPMGMSAVTVQPGATPPFTKDDVAAFIKANNLPRNMGPKEALQVDSLEFIPSAEVTRRLQGASTGLAEAEMVGFATISGGLIFTGPGPDAKAARFERGYAAFDAASGNLLMVGTLESESPR